VRAERLAALQLTDVQTEMSVYFRLWAGYRLPTSKHAGILTYFQTKVKTKSNLKKFLTASTTLVTTDQNGRFFLTSLQIKTCHRNYHFLATITVNSLVKMQIAPLKIFDT